MITEIAQIDVKPGLEAEFEAAVKKATPIFQRSKGCRGMELRRSIETPSRYRLFVSWEHGSKTTPSVSAIRPSSRNGAASSAIASRHRPMSSTSGRWYTDSEIPNARFASYRHGRLAQSALRPVTVHPARQTMAT